MAFLAEKYQRMGAGTVLAKKNLRRAIDYNKRIKERIAWNRDFDQELLGK